MRNTAPSGESEKPSTVARSLPPAFANHPLSVASVNGLAASGALMFNVTST